MPTLLQLEQLVAIYQYGTVSLAALHLHISQPALSRSMQKLEETMQLSLFDRQKNKITLNENGVLAITYAKKILAEATDMMDSLLRFEKSHHTISIGSCAPAPIWKLSPIVTSLYPEMEIVTDIQNVDLLLQGLSKDTYQIIITPYFIDHPNIISNACLTETLLLSLPLNHPLTNKKELSFKDIDGENILFFSNIGFWREIHNRTMPNSHFLIQEERFSFNELVKASALPSFTSTLVLEKEGRIANRKLVTIKDKEASVTFYCCYKKEKEHQFKNIVKEVLKGE